MAIYLIYLAFSAFLNSFIIRITRINFTILTALVAALEALDWLAICEKLDDVLVEKMIELSIRMSKTMVAVEIISRKKKKERKYPSITILEMMIST